MPGSTSSYVIPYSLSGDTVASIAATMQNLAARVDLLLGETGSFVLNGTSGSQVVTLGRTYPGATGHVPQGTVIVQYQGTLAGSTIIDHWIDTWTGSASTITGFKINWASNLTQSSRLLLWRFLPVLT